MLCRRIGFYWWYLFFSAYWTAFLFGERKEPENNASYLLNVLIGLNLFGVMEFVKYFGCNFSIATIITICVVPAIIIPYLSFKKGLKYKRKLKEFEFLKEDEYKRKRYAILVLTSTCSIVFVAIGGIIRM